MEVIFNKEANKLTVQIIDRIDTPDAKGLESDVIGQITEEIKEVELDCKQLSYISSSGLRAFFGINKKIKSVNASLNVSNVNPMLMEIFDLTGFSTLLEMS